jgi:hypothetical protein
MSTAVGWAPIVKSEKMADGTLRITGRAATSSVDRDYQIADPEWLDTALGKWYGEPDGGNIREQHDGKRAVGTAIAYDKADHSITAEIVDPLTIAKIEHKVLKGFSWSARNGRVTVDKAAAGGRIIDGQIYEVSVVDRPANPECLFTIAKADSSGDLQVVADPEFVEVDAAEVDKTDDGDTVPVIEKADDTGVQMSVNLGSVNPAKFAEILKSLGKVPSGPMQSTVTVESRADGSPSVVDTRTPLDTAKADGHKPKPYKASDADTVTCPACQRGNAPDAKHCDQCGHHLKGDPDVTVAAKADGADSGAVIEKKDFTQDERDAAAKDGSAMKDGSFVIKNAADLKNAIGLWGNSDKPAAAKKHIITRARALDLVDKLPDSWNVSKADGIAASVRALVPGVTLSKDDTGDGADGDAFDPDTEVSDVDNGMAAIAAIARLIISEAEGLAAGRMEEVWDIQTLISAVGALQYFVSCETQQEAELMSVTGKADQATTETGTEPATTPTPAQVAKTDAETTDTTTTDTTATEGAATGDLTEKALSELLDAAIAKAVQPYRDEIDLVKADMAKVLETPRPDGPARTRTTTHTAVAAKADALRTEIAYCDTQIPVTAGSLQVGYRSRRDEAETQLKKLDGAA